MKNSVANKLKQVPMGYLVIGIDPHKKKHAAVIMTQDFTTHSKFKFNNSKEGFEMALERIRMEMVRTGSRGAIFAIETGGHYWRNLAYFLDERGILLIALCRSLPGLFLSLMNCTTFLAESKGIPFARFSFTSSPTRWGKSVVLS